MAELLTPPLEGLDHVRGEAGAPLQLVMFGDFQCPFCLGAQKSLRRVRERLGERLLFAFRHLPIPERDLFYAKVLGAFLPAVLVSWVGFVLFAVVVNTTAWPVMHRVFIPTRLWLVMIVWVAPAVAAAVADEARASGTALAGSEVGFAQGDDRS